MERTLKDFERKNIMKNRQVTLNKMADLHINKNVYAIHITNVREYGV